MALSAPGLWLIDKSAYVRLAGSPESQEWLGRINRGLVRITTVTLLEVGYSARSPADADDPVIAALPVEYLTPRIEDRAVEVQRLLLARGQHRAVAIPDLLIAATAELAGLTVLHRDRDFERVAEITRQPVEWIEAAASTRGV